MSKVKKVMIKVPCCRTYSIAPNYFPPEMQEYYSLNPDFTIPSHSNYTGERMLPLANSNPIFQIEGQQNNWRHEPVSRTQKPLQRSNSFPKSHGSLTTFDAEQNFPENSFNQLSSNSINNNNNNNIKSSNSNNVEFVPPPPPLPAHQQNFYTQQQQSPLLPPNYQTYRTYSIPPYLSPSSMYWQPPPPPHLYAPSPMQNSGYGYGNYYNMNHNMYTYPVPPHNYYQPVPQYIPPPPHPPMTTYPSQHESVYASHAHSNTFHTPMVFNQAYGYINKDSFMDGAMERPLTRLKLVSGIELEDITICKQSEQDYLGLSLEIQVDQKYEHIQIYIERIEPGGLISQEPKIKRGDRIMKINGYTIKDFDHLVQCLSLPVLNLTFARSSRDFYRRSTRGIKCMPFGLGRNHSSLMSDKYDPVYRKGDIPRILKDIDETNLEIEMMDYCKHIEKVKKGKKNASWHIYNWDNQEFSHVPKCSKKEIKRKGKLNKKFKEGKKIQSNKSTLLNENSLERGSKTISPSYNWRNSQPQSIVTLL